MLYVDQVTIEILDLPIQNGWSFYSSLYEQVATMWGPQDISWFISPSNYSYKYHKP